MSILSVKNLDEKAFNYAVITVTPEAQVTLRGDSKNDPQWRNGVLGCSSYSTSKSQLRSAYASNGYH